MPFILMYSSVNVYLVLRVTDDNSCIRLGREQSSGYFSTNAFLTLVQSSLYLEAQWLMWVHALSNAYCILANSLRPSSSQLIRVRFSMSTIQEWALVIHFRLGAKALDSLLPQKYGNPITLLKLFLALSVIAFTVSFLLKQVLVQPDDYTWAILSLRFFFPRWGSDSHQLAMGQKGLGYNEGSTKRHCMVWRACGRRHHISKEHQWNPSVQSKKICA